MAEKRKQHADDALDMANEIMHGAFTYPKEEEVWAKGIHRGLEKLLAKAEKASVRMGFVMEVRDAILDLVSEGVERSFLEAEKASREYKEKVEEEAKRRLLRARRFELEPMRDEKEWGDRFATFLGLDARKEGADVNFLLDVRAKVFEISSEEFRKGCLLQERDARERAEDAGLLTKPDSPFVPRSEGDRRASAAMARLDKRSMEFGEAADVKAPAGPGSGGSRSSDRAMER